MGLYCDQKIITHTHTHSHTRLHTCEQEKCETEKPLHFCSVLFTIRQALVNKCSYYCLIQLSRRYRLFADIHRWCHPLQGAFVLHTSFIHGLHFSVTLSLHSLLLLCTNTRNRFRKNSTIIM